MKRSLSLLAVLLGCEASPSEDSGTIIPMDAQAAEDTGASDAGVIDTGPADAGSVDTGLPDAGGVQTWDDGIAPLFTAYCVPCHDTGNPNRDYNLYADAFRDRDEIRCGVAPSGMRPTGCVGFPPPGFPVGSGPSPTDDERIRIVEWIEAGAPER